jgi:dihydropteroate synthase
MRTKGIIVSLMAMMLIFIAGSAWAADIALTSIGQSPDSMMVKVVLKKMKVSPDTDNLLKAEDLEGYKILIAVVGGSSKGLGAAGIDKDQENERTLELLQAARDKGIKILVMHVGGEGRRGKLSDAFISTAVPFADELIMVEGANKDGLFDSLIEGKNIEIKTAPNVRSTSEPLKEVLSGWGIAVN